MILYADSLYDDFQYEYDDITVTVDYQYVSLPPNYNHMNDLNLSEDGENNEGENNIIQGYQSDQEISNTRRNSVRVVDGRDIDVVNNTTYVNRQENEQRKIQGELNIEIKEQYPASNERENLNIINSSIVLNERLAVIEQS